METIKQLKVSVVSRRNSRKRIGDEKADFRNRY
jgi:hypothetical protein